MLDYVVFGLIGLYQKYSKHFVDQSIRELKMYH